MPSHGKRLAREANRAKPASWRMTRHAPQVRTFEMRRMGTAADSAGKKLVAAQSQYERGEKTGRSNRPLGTESTPAPRCRSRSETLSMFRQTKASGIDHGERSVRRK
ncbi:hypothetical protein SNOG_04808 [Parastagonospora nodorum SN15]|uniref:Uncharacterized protein n=1 Tax=Phaeosphaeria nodorum (strain SN15 / ATCC MYA-4574 / FGSC 10173) TaxID=321614 RepID=Q0UTV6_PHANO|nr:hypothetical protein SNOG_04808 [Parastagonospora nodorum SN15]EAT87199.2 hypothetical protein SNOG_04808 [Parastagonospora nodorum SN15]